MASTVLRSRIVSRLRTVKTNGCGINRKSFSSETVSNPPKEAIISAQSNLSDAQPVTPPPEAAPQVSERKSGGILKCWVYFFSCFPFFYVKYRGLLYSAAMTVPAKSIELYLDLRRLVEDQVQGFTEPTSDKLLPDLHPAEQHVFTLVLDLNETLLFTDWKVRIWLNAIDFFHILKLHESLKLVAALC
ncbi:hypothetical protein SLEP1_g29674 [Rubroshorea leprosula]|uniref:FCP1 homology domain-containing protein n=1 Tax=Rubroshorea leprosula TaxID=152421 RepID=A0AAV5K877_9ROSI|nr:hypothetical protein SLEP1_g29674 [Rubroshorea leprosula]